MDTVVKTSANITRPEDFPQAKNNEKPKTVGKKQNKEGKDLYTETPFRKLGFLDEAGEALRPILSVSKNPIVQKLPNFAYIPATLYVAADVADKYKKGSSEGSKVKGVKMAAREAAFQGIVSIAAPMAIIRGVNKLTANFINNYKASGETAKLAEKAMGLLKDNKLTSDFVNKAGMAGKFAGAAISLIALSKLTKPVDFVTKKVFQHVVDPVMGLNKSEEA